jgi:hypothetical protein
MRDLSIRRVGLGLLLGCLMTISNLSNAQKFVIPVFPDSHVGIPDRIEMFYTQMRWVVRQKDSLNIPFVCHVGDMVNCDNLSHWEIASRGFKVLDSAGVAYAITLGNHDTEAVGVNSGSAAPGNVNQNLRKTTKFNTYFPVSRFKAQGGRYEEGKSDNAYYTFKAGGLNWMVISLEFCARKGPVDWADMVVASHPNYNVIILTHYFLNPNGDIGETNAGYGDLSPMEIYNQLIVKYPNILLVLCGHNYISSWRNDRGENGNRIYQILQDFTDSADYAGGYLRLLEIDPEKRLITGNAFSPLYNKWKQDGSMIRFTGVKFIQPK